MTTYELKLDVCLNGCKKKLYTVFINEDTGDILMICPKCNIKYKSKLKFISREKVLQVMRNNRKEDG